MDIKEKLSMRLVSIKISLSLGLQKLNGALRELEEHFGEEEKDLSYDIRTKGYRLYLDAKAEDGDADFQYEAGDSYRWGICGAEIDDKKAIYWFEKALAQGHLEANCGICRLSDDW